MQGSLFTRDFLEEGIAETTAWHSLEQGEIDRLASEFRALFAAFPVKKQPNESQTEEDMIHPALRLLGWVDYLTQQNMAPKGRDDVPDLLLFPDAAAKARANEERKTDAKFRHGLAVAESKKWLRPLDRGGSDGVPSTQMLRYLGRADVVSEGRIKWGILTNGRHWRLYWQDARSRAEEFVELDLPVILGIAGCEPDLFSKPEQGNDHYLKVFILLFGRASFLPSEGDARSFHEIAIAETRRWEARIADDLSDLVFTALYPAIVTGIVANDRGRPRSLDFDYLEELRRASLTFLYRLLFVLYAEDRNLLPVKSEKYDDYSLDGLREQIASRVDRGDAFSEVQHRYHDALNDLFRAIDRGDKSIGLPAYNGGLFHPDEHPLLDRIRLPDAILAPILDGLSRRTEGGRRRRINYRDLSVQQLGSIYERLLEFAVRVDADGKVGIEPDIFARKTSGSFYTPEDLVGLIIRRAVGPLVDEINERFRARAESLAKDRRPKHDRLSDLARDDPASAMLELKVCDPAMGSGHFLVSLVDYLTDRILLAVAEAEAGVSWADPQSPYRSPLVARIDQIRKRLLERSHAEGWTVDPAQLDDRHIIRRMVLKRVIYGVDKNPMAVELAKVSLWLHTFTVGAPLSFLDHHLRIGDSLYGEQVHPVEEALRKAGAGLFMHQPMLRAKQAAKGMLMIEQQTDADLTEVETSARLFAGVAEDTSELAAFLDFFHALRWLDAAIVGRKADPAAQAVVLGSFGDPMEVIANPEMIADAGPGKDAEMRRAAAELIGKAKALARRERFLHWHVAFPGVWSDWESAEPQGGFDAVIGNPPWDRIKLQEVEWFASRRPEIAKATPASNRKRMIKALEKAKDPLWDDYRTASEAAEAAARVARESGYYPFLSGGDVNIYALFVERALALVKPSGIVGLVVPSGIAADKSASRFFGEISAGGRLGTLYDFENRWPSYFPDVDSRFKFSIFVVGGRKRNFAQADCAFMLNGAATLADPDRHFFLTPADFARVNPNTGTAPIFRRRRDADIVLDIYRRFPVLVEHAKGEAGRIWPVRYVRMFDMTNDAGLFKTRAELEAEGFYPVEGNRLRKGKNEYLPLYVGKTVWHFDHRAASVAVNDDALKVATSSERTTDDQHARPDFHPEPQYWVDAGNVEWPPKLEWAIGFRDITNATNERTMIAAIVPKAAFGNKLPLLLPDSDAKTIAAYREFAPLLLSNFCSFVFDFVARSKVQGTNANWYIVEQLPVLRPADFGVKIGQRTARDIVRDHVLRLVYTSDDMAPFARDMGHEGPPFPWDPEERRHLRARLDALFFRLYGLDEEKAGYVMDSFPIVREEDEKAFGRYRTKDMILAYMKALAAGDSESRVAP